MSEPLPPEDADGAEVLRSEERLAVDVERVPTEIVRVGKRVVSEERTVTVVVRREEFFLESLPVDTSRADRPSTGSRDAVDVVELVLHEEEVEVSTRSVPRERVRVHVDRVAGTARFTDTLRREVVEIDTGGGEDQSTER